VARAQMSAKRAAVSAGGRASLTQGLTRRPCPRRARTCAKSTKDVESKAEDAEGEQESDLDLSGTAKRSRAAKAAKKDLSIQDVNPVALGQRSRQFFDTVWRGVNSIGGIARSSAPIDDDIESVIRGGAMCTFESPQAKYTTVLVVGITGRVGRILARKLLLRGYAVKALVRSKDEEVKASLPRAVQVVYGDVGEPADCKEALKGCNKVVYLAGARSTATSDLYRVEQQGVQNFTQALLDQKHASAETGASTLRTKRTLFRFKSEESLEEWACETSSTAPAGMVDNMSALGLAKDRVDLQRTECGKGAVFTSQLYARNMRAEMYTEMSEDVLEEIDQYDGFVLRICGDNKPYAVNLYCTAEEDGEEVERVYMARFNARGGFSTLRLPFSNFIARVPGDPPLDITQIHSISISYDSRRLPRSSESTVQSDDDSNKTRLEVRYVKLMPRGDEPDFLLVSCTGTRDSELSEADTEKLLMYKGRGESALRNSGLGYTIIRPGALKEEPGGQKALVFDQGGRITQGISCADVADVCLRGLHDTTARNKSFEVCYEYIPEEGSLYELIAHLPDKSNSYLTSAMAQLDANT